MNVTLIGANGLLGQDIVKHSATRSWNLATPTRNDLDVVVASSVESVLSATQPDWVINCAAFVAVDDAETKADEAYAINEVGAGNVARVCATLGARMVHISTDYVFDGFGSQPYREDDKVGPLGVYAKSKLAGEVAVLANAPNAVVARTAWLYGIGRDNFPLRILRAAQAGKSLRLVSDRIGSPTYTYDLGIALANMIDGNVVPGIYNVVNEGEASWYTLCKAMVEHAGIEVDIEVASNADYPTPAQRPMYSALSTDKLKSADIPQLPHWSDAIRRFVDELRAANAI